MRTIIITALLPFSLLAQFKIGQIRIIPTTDGTAVGQIEFDTTRADGKAVVLKAPNTATASYTLTLPTAAPASNGHCLTGTTAGVLSFAACPGAGAVLTTTNQEVEGFKYFGVSGSDRLVIYRIADNQMGIQTMLDGQTDPTTYAYGGVNNQLLLQPREGVVGVGAIDTSFRLNVAGTFRAAGAVTLASTLAVAGVTTLSGDLRFGTDNTHAIGETGTRPSVVFSRIDNTRKLEISDTSGGSGFWDQRVNASAITSNWTLRDNAGSRALAYTRVFTSSPSNSFEVFGALLPAQRSTGSGDAVNDATSPSLGATARRWNTVWADSAEITSAVSSPTFIASANFQGAVDNVTDVGQSSLRMANVWTYGLDAVGTIKLKSSSTIGQVWTATGTDGSGDWATPATSPWVVSGSDLYYNTGDVAIGDTTTSIARLLARTSNVNVLAIHNSGTSSSTAGAGIQAAMESTPSSGHRLAFYSFGSFVSGTRYNGASVTAFTTENWTLGSAQGTELRLETTANGAATRTASVVARASGATVAGSLGINTSTPAHALEVIGATAKVYSGTNTDDTTLHIGNGDTGAPGQGAFLAFVASAATPYFSINALSQGVAWRDIALVNSGGSVCVGCTSPSAKLDVSGTFRATGAATFGSTSTFAGAVAVGSTDLTAATLFSRAADVNGLRIHNSGTPSPSGGAGIQAAIETAPASGDRLAFYAFGLRTGGTNYNGANITAFATQNWTPGSAQGTELRFEATANGAASRTASVVVTAAGLAVAGNLSFTGTLNTSISTTELGYLDGVTAAIQTQLNDRVTLGTTQTISGAKTFSTNAVVADVGFRSIGSSTSYSASRKLEVHVDGTGSNFFYWQSPSSNVLTLFNPAGSAAQTWDIAISRMTLHGDIYPGGTSGTRELGATASRFATAWITNLNISGTVTGNIVPASSNTLGTLAAPWTTFIGVGTVQSAIDPATNGGAELGESAKRWSTVWTQALDASGAIKFSSGAVNGYCLKSDASGNASWQTCGTSGVTSIATSSPISGGTITTTGTISCPTCFTTSGGSISGSISPGSTATYDLGGSSFRWRNAHVGDVYVYGGVVAPNGNFGDTDTITVRDAAGTGTCTLIFSGGIKTGGTC
jgi:hypothetical protein